MECKNCGTMLPERIRFCPECGAAVLEPETAAAECAATEEISDIPAAKEPVEGLIYYDGAYSWKCEIPALQYKAIFTVSRWVIGLIGGIVTVLFFFLVSPLNGLAALGVTAAAYLLTAGSLLLVRGGKFHGNFTFSPETVTLREETNPPENIFLMLLYLIFKLLKGIVRIIWLFSGVEEMFILTSGTSAIHRQCKLKKVRAVSASADRTMIVLHKSVGSMKLPVTPEQCDILLPKLQKCCGQQAVTEC